MTHLARAFSGSIINRFTGSKILARVGQISVAFPAAIGAAHGKTGAQVALRYLLQRGIIVIPKSVRKERMEQNLHLFDFTLTDSEMDEILKLDTAKPLIMPSHHDPEITKWFMSFAPRNH